MANSDQRRQVRPLCPKCSAILLHGRDLPGCWRCGWEDYEQRRVVLGSLVGSPMADLASRGQSRQQVGSRRNRNTK